MPGQYGCMYMAWRFNYVPFCICVFYWTDNLRIDLKRGKVAKSLPRNLKFTFALELVSSIRLHKWIMADHPLCEICGSSSAKVRRFCEICTRCQSHSTRTFQQYKCPRCFLRSCSLGCSKSHKESAQCSGQRSTTHFIPKEALGPNELTSGMTIIFIIHQGLVDELTMIHTKKTMDSWNLCIALQTMHLETIARLLLLEHHQLKGHENGVRKRRYYWSMHLNEVFSWSLCPKVFFGTPWINPCSCTSPNRLHGQSSSISSLLARSFKFISMTI